MIDGKRLHALLEQNWPDECEIAGPATVTNIVNGAIAGNAQFRRAPGAANWDSDVVRVLLETALVVKAGFDVWDLLELKHGRPPNEGEFLADVENRLSASKLATSLIANALALYRLLAGS